MTGRKGDRLILESEHVGERGREGEILEVLGEGDGLHYRVRWQDGHESLFYPLAGSSTVVPAELQQSGV